MIPIYLEQFPPFSTVERDHDQTHLSLSTQAKDSSFSYIISYTTPQAQEATYREDHHYHHKPQHLQQQEANEFLPIAGSSSPPLSFPVDNKNYDDIERSSSDQFTKIENAHESAKWMGNAHESAKWMSSKMRFMRKMMDSDQVIKRKPRRNMQALQQHSSQESSSCVTNNPGGIIRVCSDCNTTKTPLWRSGPSGPKSLCNACGIRQRKARRAMAAAGAASSGFVPATPPKVQKEKRSDEDRTLPYKKRCKITGNKSSEKLFFDDITIKSSQKNQDSAFHRVFPQDERDAAILLMALSCGLIHG